MGNDINNMVVERRNWAKVWNNEAIVYITTANRKLGSALVANAKAHGFASDRIYVEPVGANVETGSDGSGERSGDADPLRAAQERERVGRLDQRRDRQRARPTAFRPPSGAPVARFQTPSYTQQDRGQRGRLPAGALNELSHLLLRTWLIEHEGRPVALEAMITSEHVDAGGEPYGLVGADCIAKGTSCLGDNQDTDAYRFGVVGRRTGTHMAFIAGVNHALVKNADYISLAIYNMQDFTGVASISQSNPNAVGFNSGSLTGSAEGVLKALDLYGSASAQLKAALPKLYTAIVARRCTVASHYCVALDERKALPLSVGISVTQRAYIKPGTTTGANPDKLLTPILVFRPEF